MLIIFSKCNYNISANSLMAAECSEVSLYFLGEIYLKCQPNTAQSGPLPVLNGVIAPINRVTTPVPHLFSAIYRGPTTPLRNAQNDSCIVMTSCFTKKKSIWIWTMSSTPSGPLKIAKHKACREHSCDLPMRFTLVNQPDWPKKPGLSAQTLYKQEGNWSSPGTQWLTLVSNNFGTTKIGCVGTFKGKDH